MCTAAPGAADGCRMLTLAHWQGANAAAAAATLTTIWD